jgi:hypothetical protein
MLHDDNSSCASHSARRAVTFRKYTGTSYRTEISSYAVFVDGPESMSCGHVAPVFNDSETLVVQATK